MEEPIRAELFGAERLEQHAESLAAADHVTEKSLRGRDLLPRITVENPKGVCRGVSRVSLDGTLLSGQALVPLSDDGSEHRVQVVLG